MKSGEYGMVLNIDGYTSVDGWLSVNDQVLLGGDANYAITGSMTEIDGAVEATVCVRSSDANRHAGKFDFEDVVLAGVSKSTTFVLRGAHDGVVVEVRGQRRSG